MLFKPLLGSCGPYKKFAFPINCSFESHFVWVFPVNFVLRQGQTMSSQMIGESWSRFQSSHNVKRIENLGKVKRFGKQQNPT